MKKTFGEKLKQLFSKDINEDFYDDLTDMLVEGDVGAKASYQIVEELESICSKEKIKDQNLILQKLKELLLKDVFSCELNPTEGKVNVWMILGVNGVGKTTSVAKMANCYKSKGEDNLVDITPDMILSDDYGLER